MLRRIEVGEVELGMFIHKLEGSWFKHPFWKKRFLLEDADALSVLQASEVAGVIIDTAKGLDLTPRTAVPAAAAPVPTAVPVPLRPATTPRPPHRGPSPFVAPARPAATAQMAREFGKAKAVAERSLRVVSRVFLDARLGKAISAKQVEPVIEDIYASVQRNASAFNGLMRCRRKNESVYRHALAISALMISLAIRMRLPPEKVREAGMAGLLLDVGVSLLPDAATLDNGDYRNAPPDVWQQHVMLGHEMLEAAGGIPEAVLVACRQHHENLDGTGFPHSLRGEEIAPIARMAAICDSFEHLLYETSEGRRLDPATSVQRLSEMEGCFDPDIFARFVEAIGIYPIGSFVRLRSDRLAMVVCDDNEDPARPTVVTFYSLELEKRIRYESIALAHCYGQDAIVGVADLEGLVLPDLPMLREMLFLAACKTAS